MAGTDAAMIFAYVVFLGFLGLMLSNGGPLILDNPPEAPPDVTSTLAAEIALIHTPDGGLDLVNLLASAFVIPITLVVFVLSELVYLATLIGVTSVAYPWLGVILTAWTAALIYVLLGRVPLVGK